MQNLNARVDVIMEEKFEFTSDVEESHEDEEPRDASRSEGDQSSPIDDGSESLEESLSVSNQLS